jgi:DNA-3-methyladenine glycosylase
MKLLSRSFFLRNTVDVAHDLLGKIVVREYRGQMLTGRIVETEAYTCLDEACHGFRGPTPRTQALFGPVGHAYIYFIYGMHYALNVVARDKHTAAGGVLIRALEPLQGIEYMQKLRKLNKIKNLTNGPGKLAQALHITKTLYGTDLTHKGELYFMDDGFKPEKIKATKRIGISKGQESLWRFIIPGNHFLSHK